MLWQDVSPFVCLSVCLSVTCILLNFSSPLHIAINYFLLQFRDCQIVMKLLSLGTFESRYCDTELHFVL